MHLQIVTYFQVVLQLSCNYFLILPQPTAGVNSALGFVNCGTIFRKVLFYSGTMINNIRLCELIFSRQLHEIEMLIENQCGNYMYTL
jgi:hypothetical protein